MNQKKTWLSRMADFISGKGFYLVVLVCVAAIGVSGYYLMWTLGGLSQPPDSPVSVATQVVELSPRPSLAPKPDPEDLEEQRDGLDEESLSQPPTTPVVSTPPVTPAPTQPPAAARVFTWPVNGAVIAPFSVEVLAYDETMRDWRTHGGIDIAAELGARVQAAAAGTVTELYEDDLMGVTLIIDHGGGLQSVYSNLSEKTVVQVGDSVYTGDAIGTVGETAVAESGRPSHLHLAMYQDGTAIDPESRLPK